ncbi:MAG: DNA primase [Pseudomonadota bacterium]
MAGLISQSFIDDLLERSDIVDVVGARVSLKKSGQNHTALCPFHQEKTPSFSVNQEKQFYYCFGCGAGGNSIQFIMDFDRVDFPQSVERLASTQGMEVVYDKASSPQARQRERQQREVKLSLTELMERLTQFFQAQLDMPSGQYAREYIQARGLAPRVVESFQLGFAPEDSQVLMQHFARTEDELALLKQTGVLVEGDDGRVYARFRNRLMFPIRDRRGRVVSFGGRTLNNAKAKYLNGPETELFHKSRELYGLFQARQARKEPEHIIICEGYMDVIALHQHGVHNAVATLGTATNEQHLHILLRYCPHLVFSFDGDQAGQRAAGRAFQAVLPLLQDGVRASFLFLPDGEDPDSLVNAEGEAAFRVRVRQAMSFSDYLFSRLLSDSDDVNDVSVKARLSKQAVELIRQVPGLAYRDLLMQELQQRTGLSQSVLIQLLSDVERSERRGHHAQVSSDVPSATLQTPVKRSAYGLAHKRLTLTAPRRMLSIILNHPKLAVGLNTGDIPGVNADELLLSTVVAHIQAHPDHGSHRLMGHWMNDPNAELLMQLLADGVEVSRSEATCRDEVHDCLKHMQQQHAQNAQQQLIMNIAQQKGVEFDQLDPILRDQVLAFREDYKKSR